MAGQPGMSDKARTTAKSVTYSTNHTLQPNREPSAIRCSLTAVGAAVSFSLRSPHRAVKGTMLKTQVRFALHAVS